VLDELLPLLRSPVLGTVGLFIDQRATVRRGVAGQLLETTLVGPHGEDASHVRDGIWHALGDQHPPRSLAQVTNVLPPTAHLYERLWRSRSMTWLSGRPFPLREERAEMLTALGDVSGAAIIDVGCSEGLYARHLAGQGALVLAIDHSTRFLRRSVRRADEEHVRLAPVRALAQRLPVQDASFDGAVIGGTLNEIGDLDGAIAELARALKVGAPLFLMSLVRATTRAGRVVQTATRAAGIVFPDEDQTVSLLRRHGFVVRSTRRDGIVLRTAAHR
jgi:SAM-dependent methyltransferase